MAYRNTVFVFLLTMLTFTACGRQEPVEPTGSGNTSIRFAVPNSQNLVGVQFYQQFYVNDPPANNLGVVLTNGAAGTIGGQF